MNAHDLAVLSRLLDQHHTIAVTGPAYAKGKCPTCRYRVAADGAGVWHHRLLVSDSPAAVRLWLERHRRVA